jgi:hypothetical protein
MKRAEHRVQAIGPVRMTELCPHQKIAPVPRGDLLDLWNALRIALEQDKRRRLQPLRILARSGVNIRHGLQKAITSSTA